MIRTRCFKCEALAPASATKVTKAASSASWTARNGKSRGARTIPTPCTETNETPNSAFPKAAPKTRRSISSGAGFRSPSAAARISVHRRSRNRVLLIRAQKWPATLKTARSMPGSPAATGSRKRRACPHGRRSHLRQAELGKVRWYWLCRNPSGAVGQGPSRQDHCDRTGLRHGALPASPRRHWPKLNSAELPRSNPELPTPSWR